MIVAVNFDNYKTDTTNFAQLDRHYSWIRCKYSWLRCSNYHVSNAIQLEVVVGNYYQLMSRSRFFRLLAREQHSYKYSPQKRYSPYSGQLAFF